MIGKGMAPLDKERLRGGELSVLRNHLLELDKRIITKLKADKDETRFYQGASCAVDYILEILK